SDSNANKPGYKKTKLGWIPEDWEIYKLDQLGSFKNGINKSKHAFGKGNPLVKLMDVFENREISNYPDGLIETNTKECKEYSLKQGDILFVRSSVKPSGVGLTALISDTLDKTTYSGFLIRFRTYKEDISKYFKKYIFQAPYFRVHLLNKSTISANTNINQNSLKNLFVALPPLPEQQKIAQILSTWDQAIEKTEQLIEKKQLLKKGLMQQLLSGKVRFPEFNDSWQEVKLGEVFKERNESGYNHLPLLAITDQNGVIYRDQVDKRDTSNPDKSKYKRICPGDIGYNTMRLWQGRSALSELEGIVSPAYTVVTPKEHVDALFMSYFFKLPKTIHLFYRYSQGLVSDTLNCKYKHFKLVHVKIPPTKKEQAKIGNLLKKQDKEIKQLQNQVELLKKQKKGLMQKLLTGRIRVKTD
ncbi:MAG: restriction endonuclease subunit S, partial [bacterium]